MADQILKTRLAEVRRTLERASLTRLSPQKAPAYEEETNWITVGLSLPTLEGQVIVVSAGSTNEAGKYSWGFLEGQFKQESEQIASKIMELETSLEKLSGNGRTDEERRAELVKLWAKYAELESRSESLLGEIVELLGGLALRDRSVDPWFFAIADQLVGWYVVQARDSLGVLTVPIVRAVARTLIQIVGLRFPEWSVWALPLTAYEFAYQYLDLGPGAAKMRAMIKEDLEGLEVSQMGDQRVLLADAFATYTIGPAYLLAALGLRLSPQDAHRAVVIFRILEILEHFDEDETYKKFLDSFRGKWQSSPASGTGLDVGRKEQLEHFADTAFKALKKRYTPYLVSDWQRAQEIKKEWTKNAKAGVPLKVPTIAQLMLIDVLNAAWLSRFEEAATTEKLETAARKVCSLVINPPGKAGTGTGQTAPATTGGGR